MGHAFNQTIMDGLTRYYRMKGRNVCWVPGTDHAGIAKLSKLGCTDKAPAHLVEKDQAELAELQEKMAKV